jgi:hypothetical protein
MSRSRPQQLNQGFLSSNEYAKRPDASKRSISRHATVRMAPLSHILMPQLYRDWPLAANFGPLSFSLIPWYNAVCFERISARIE